nr:MULTISPECIES: Ltp family lipoprotein [unclassified Microbacterium]
MSFDNTPPPSAPQLPPTGGPTAPGGYPPPPALATPPPSGVASASDKSFIATWLLSWLLGILGVDRFYLGKVGTGIAKLVTLGGLGIWYLIDLIITLTGNATDREGRKVRGRGKEPIIAWSVTGAVFLIGLIGNIANGATSQSPVPATSSALEQADESSAPADTRAAIPTLTGKTVAEARTSAEEAGFILVVPEGTGDDWTVVSQSIAAGSKADASAEIPVTAEAPKPVLTVAQENAIKKAKNYLDFSGFSRSGLISQLEYEGFSPEDAAFAADNVGADWNAEAAEKAKSYMDMTAFSRDGLYDQLEYEGFTPEQIGAGLAAVGY